VRTSWDIIYGAIMISKEPMREGCKLNWVPTFHEVECEQDSIHEVLAVIVIYVHVHDDREFVQPLSSGNLRRSIKAGRYCCKLGLDIDEVVRVKQPRNTDEDEMSLKLDEIGH
jgi:hypothetical protein